MPTKYNPNYPDPNVEPDVPNISGRSPRENVSIEEAAQRAVAENASWLLAKEQNMNGDSRQALEALGFTVLGEADDLFYQVQPPQGWDKSTQGYWTTVTDDAGNERISQFYKGAWYDRRAFLSIRNQEG